MKTPSAGCEETCWEIQMEHTDNTDAILIFICWNILMSMKLTKIGLIQEKILWNISYTMEEEYKLILDLIQ